MSTEGRWVQVSEGRSVYRPAGQPDPESAGGYVFKVDPAAIARILSSPLHDVLLEMSRRAVARAAGRTTDAKNETDRAGTRRADDGTEGEPPMRHLVSLSPVLTTAPEPRTPMQARRALVQALAVLHPPVMLDALAYDAHALTSRGALDTTGMRSAAPHGLDDAWRELGLLLTEATMVATRMESDPDAEAAS